MKILYASPFLPYPPVDGGRLIAYHHVKELATRGHDLTMVFGRRRPEDAENVSEIESFGKVILVPVPERSRASVAARALHKGKSARISHHAYPEVAAAFATALDDAPDVIYLDSLFTGYLVGIAREKRPDTPIALFQHNVESLVFRRHVSSRGGIRRRLFGMYEVPKVTKAERRVLEGVDAVLAISEEDAITMRAMCRGVNPITLGPGIDTFEGEVIPPPPDPDVALFLGSHNWAPNRDGARWLVRAIWPRVRARVPGARLVIAGHDPRGTAKNLGDPANGIDSIGFVDDPNAATRAAAITLAPVRYGGGIRLKILEALANERTVVSTKPGAEGLPFRTDRHLLLRDGAESFAAGIVELLSDPKRAARLAKEGRKLVEGTYSWGAVVGRLEDVLEGLRQGGA